MPANTVRVSDLLSTRASKFDRYNVLAQQPELNDNERTEYDTLHGEIVSLSDQITRARAAEALSASTAIPSNALADPNAAQSVGQVMVRGAGGHWRVPASAELDPYANDEAARALAVQEGTLQGSAKSLVVGGMIKMCALASGDIYRAREIAKEHYGGESHPVVRALITAAGASGGFIIPPDYMNEIIELLRPMAVVRSAGPRVIPMPRGTMRLPGQASPATATYGAEDTKIPASQQTLRSIVATFKKLTALVPVSNDMMRYADPSVDAFVRDDLVQVIALREDKGMILDDGTQDQLRGFLSFANGWVLSQGGTVGVFSSTGNSTLAVNAAPGDLLSGNNGGGFITANETFTLATAAAEFGGAINKLDAGNVPDRKRVWFWNPRTKNYLFNVQNSLGVYVFRDEMTRGTFLGYPFKNTNQIPTNLWDANGANKDCSLVFLVEMTEDMILDSMSLELAISREGTYVDASGNTVSAFQNDETLIRAIAEHDHQMRHDSAVAVIQNARYAPQLT